MSDGAVVWRPGRGGGWRTGTWELSGARRGMSEGHAKGRNKRGKGTGDNFERVGNPRADGVIGAERGR